MVRSLQLIMMVMMILTYIDGSGNDSEAEIMVTMMLTCNDDDFYL